MNRSFLIFSFLLICNFTKAQIDKEFWFAIPKETSGHGNITTTNNVSFKIAAMSLPAHVIISMPANPAFTVQNYYVPAGTSKIAVLATSFAQFATVYNNNAASAAEAVTGKTNRGILVQSDNDITVYYDYDNDFNRDLFSLKGKNALGTDFYCPFQQIWTNGNGYVPRPLSSAEIVATEDNTTITVYPTVKFKSRPNSNPFNITLNRGEAYSMVDSSQTAAGHAAGTRITSNKNISVTINDDSGKGANSTCYDIMGDQLIPVSITGYQYLIMSGSSSLTHATAGITPHDAARGDQIVVTATQPNTSINFRGVDGTLLYTTTLNAGQTDYFSIDITKTNQTSIYVSCIEPSKPFYVQHITGIGCELGGAIVPPITNCTGSNEVTFYPSYIAPATEVTVNLMIPFDKNYTFTDSVHQSYYNFTLFNSTYPSGFHIPGSWFEKNDSAGWAILSINNRNFGQTGITAGKNIVTWGANKIINTQKLFHLGMTNGRQAYTNKYGYFSSFSAIQAQVRVASTDTQNYTGCYGENITLVANGGTDYTWHYGSPSGSPTYLNDPKSPNPEVSGLPAGSHDFYVEVKQAACFGTAILKVNVVILPQNKANFHVDQSAVCAPANIFISNESTGNNASYTWDFGDGSPTSNSGASSFTHLYRNTTTTPLTRTIKLVVQNSCGIKDSVSQDITTYPEVHAQFTSTMTSYCSPRQVDFANNSNAVATKFIWNFGDNTTSLAKDTTHIYTNNAMRDTIYNAFLTAISDYGCKDSTSQTSILVYPYLEPYFALDKAAGCNPLTVQITNGSLIPYVEDYWNFGGTNVGAQPKVFSHVFENTGNSNKNFNIKLQISYKGICQKSYNKQVIVYSPILPKVSANMATVCNNSEITFKDSTNQVLPPYNYKWDFGDGGSAVGIYGANRSIAVLTNHQYNNFQTVSKTLKATFYGYSQFGCTKDTSINIIVFPNVKASFSFDTPAGCSPMILPLKNGSTPTATWVRFWDNEDNPSAGYPYTYLPATQIYSNNQDTSVMVYHPKLKVAYLYNQTPVCADSLTKSIQVYSRASANFSVDKTEGTSPLTVSFINNSKNSTSYFWDFSDNATSTSFNPVHEFVNKGTKVAEYSVKLSASNPNCAPDTSIITIIVKPEINTGIPISKSLELKFYPNPTKDKINIQYTLLKSSDVIIELLESSGRLMNKSTELKPAGTNITSIDLSTYKGMLFFIKILWNGESTVLKVVKED